MTAIKSSNSISTTAEAIAREHSLAKPEPGPQNEAARQAPSNPAAQQRQMRQQIFKRFRPKRPTDPAS